MNYSFSSYNEIASNIQDTITSESSETITAPQQLLNFRFRFCLLFVKNPSQKEKNSLPKFTHNSEIVGERGP